MQEVHALRPVILLLVVGILAITLTRPLRLSPIVGYLAAGLLVGPHALGLIAESDTTRLLAELGVVFLLFRYRIAFFADQYLGDAPGYPGAGTGPGCPLRMRLRRDCCEPRC